MEPSGGTRSRGQDLGLLVALIAVLMAPVAIPSAAAAPGENPSLASSLFDETGGEAQAAREASLTDPGSTVGALAAIVVGTGIVSLLWWAIVIRRRRG